MARPRHVIISTFAALLLLSGCAPSAPGESSPTPSPNPSTPAASESPATPEELVLPTTCEDLFPESTEAALTAEGLEPLGDTSGAEGYGASDPSLQAMIEANESVSCTWVLPGSERGLSTSVTIVSDADREAVAAALLAAGFAQTSAVGEYYSMESGGEFPHTETHALYEDFWVATLDGFGTSASLYTEDAMGTVNQLNF
ncbi:hypothetical protein [Agromyces sp. Soil535]|uniref:hypothetical protein n=1 Tax=Agromyces sp. Soil535 TaxID=1736390 RepID=UPI0012E3CCCD|nr:hypothetical protein [Agromyces sp. Soil535]